jgi:hypothetical protein
MKVPKLKRQGASGTRISAASGSGTKRSRGRREEHVARMFANTNQHDGVNGQRQTLAALGGEAVPQGDPCASRRLMVLRTRNREIGPDLRDTDRSLALGSCTSHALRFAKARQYRRNRSGSIIALVDEAQFSNVVGNFLSKQ